ERTTALDVERLVDRLVADAHGLIIREVDLQALRDLLRTPRRRPAPVLTTGLVQPFPRRRSRTRPDRAVRPANVPGEPVVDVLAQSRIGRQLGLLRALGCDLGLPLRGRRSVPRVCRSRGRIAAQLAGDRRRIPTDPATDLAWAVALS